MAVKFKLISNEEDRKNIPNYFDVKSLTTIVDSLNDCLHKKIIELEIVKTKIAGMAN